MEDTVRSFNSLPRPQTIPSGCLPSSFTSDLPNHWVFGIRSLSNVSEKAEAILPLLLKAFSTSDRGPWKRPGDPPLFAPWTWATTEDRELAKALEKCLGQHGVMDELCRVDMCSQDEKTILNGAWDTVTRDLTILVGQGPELLRPQRPLSAGDTTRCHGCGISSDLFSEPLKKCAECGIAWYHSQDCLVKYWKEHKPTCLANRPANGSTLSSTGAVSTKMDGRTYYNTTARSSPEAQTLMRTLHLSFPTSPTANESLAIPLRSLVYAGKDTPENMKLLFGPDWSSTIGKRHDKTRIEILLDPPRGSSSYATHQRLGPDGRLERSPRPATESEKQVIRKVRELQGYIRRSIVAGKVPSMVDILGNSHHQMYLLAIDTMNLGIVEM